MSTLCSDYYYLGLVHDVSNLSVKKNTIGLYSSNTGLINEYDSNDLLFYSSSEFLTNLVVASSRPVYDGSEDYAFGRPSAINGYIYSLLKDGFLQLPNYYTRIGTMMFLEYDNMQLDFYTGLPFQKLETNDLHDENVYFKSGDEPRYLYLLDYEYNLSDRILGSNDFSQWAPYYDEAMGKMIYYSPTVYGSYTIKANFYRLLVSGCSLDFSKIEKLIGG